MNYKPFFIHTIHPNRLAVAHENKESKPQRIKPANVTTAITIIEVEVVSDLVGHTTLFISFLESRIILNAIDPSEVLRIIRIDRLIKMIIPITL